MRSRTSVFVGTLLVGAFGLGTLWSQEDPAKAMEEWLKLTAPNENHARLEMLVGTFDVTGKFWMDPAAPPSENTGTSTFTWMLGKRFVKHEHTSQFMGAPFEGFGMTGWDPLKQKYVGVWTDTMGAGLYSLEGTYDPKTESFTFEGTWPDPMSGPGATLQAKAETKKTATGFVDTFWEQKKGEKEWRKTMELTYTKK